MTLLSVADSFERCQARTNGLKYHSFLIPGFVARNTVIHTSAAAFVRPVWDALKEWRMVTTAYRENVNYL